MSDSPAVLLYDGNNNPMAVQNGVAIPASTSGILLMGSDGTNSRYLTVDSSGRPVVVGAGTAGTPAGGVVSIQGVSGGQAVPISGSITATNPSVGTDNAAKPTSDTLIGGSDGTNVQAERVFDLDTGAGTEFNLGVSLRLPASGGSVAGGTSTNPVRTDPTGTTTQPVSQGTAAAASGAWPAKVTDGTNVAAVKAASAAAVAADPALVVAVSPNNTPVLPNGAATAAKQPAIGTAGTPSADVLSVQGVSGGTPQPVSGTVTANQGTAAALASGWPVKVTDGTNSMPTMDVAARAGFEKITDGTNTAAVKAGSTPAAVADPALVVAVSPNNTVAVAGGKTNNNAAPGATNIGALPAVANAAAPTWTEGNQVALSTLLTGALRGDVSSWMGSTTPSVGQKAMAASLPVSVASDQPPLANASTTGNITSGSGASSYVALAAQGYSSCMVVLTGTWTATLVFEVSSDGGTTWVQGAFVTPPAVLSPMPLTTLTIAANGTYQGVGMGAVTNVRVRASAFTSGPVAVRLVVSDANPGLVGSFTSIQQNALVSINNNSVANLAAAAAFTGTSESTLGVNSIQVNFKADQPCTIQVQQSPDGTNWDINDSYFLGASIGDGRTFQATGSYYRVIVTNVGGATTTYLRLQTVLCPVADPMPRSLGPNGGMLVEPGMGTGGWIPSTPSTFFGFPRGTRAPLPIGPDGTLQCYSEVLTDAGSFREDYPGSSLQSNLTGTVQFTNGSTRVTGSGCAFTTQLSRFAFIKLTGQADSVLASVANVIDDNTLTLAAAYTGATGSGVGIVSFWSPSVGTGGSISVASSLLAIASGTTSGANTWVQRGSDYGPMNKTLRFNVSQRIANQTIRLGFFDSFTSPTQMACVEMTGTDNTQVTLTCRSSAAAADLESVTVTLPSGINTGTTLNLILKIFPDRVALFYDPTDGSPIYFLAMCKNHLPGLYTSLVSGHGILNTGTAGSTTTLNVDLVYLNDYNLVATHEEQGGVAPDALVAACTNVAAAAADTTLLAANKFRNMACFVNDSTAILYLKFGTGASTTSYTARLTPYAYYELPVGANGQVYNGQINGYWASATGNARVTEMQ